MRSAVDAAVDDGADGLNLLIRQSRSRACIAYELNDAARPEDRNPKGMDRRSANEEVARKKRSEYQSAPVVPFVEFRYQRQEGGDGLFAEYAVDLFLVPR